MWTKALAFLLLATVSAIAETVTSTNTVDFTQAGIPGGIPTVSTVYTTVSAGASQAEINAALAACPSNQVVQLESGTYTLTSSIIMRKNGAVLRGVDGTVITVSSAAGFSGVAEGGSVKTMILMGDEDLVTTTRTLTGSLLLGETNFTVNSGSSFAVGQMIEVWHSNPAYVTGGTGSQGFMAMITGVSGADLTVWPPSTWDLVNSPTCYLMANRIPYQRMGLENLKIDCNELLEHGVYMGGLYSCWVSGVTSTNALERQLRMFRCVQNTIPSNLMGGSPEYGGSMGVGINLPAQDSYNLIVDNALVACFPGIMAGDAGSRVSGNVFAYNYVYNGFSDFTASNTWAAVDLDLNHGYSSGRNLWEGNKAEKIQADNYFGSSSSHIIFRNRSGLFLTHGTNIVALDFVQHTYFSEVLGNIFGDLTAPGTWVFEPTADGASIFDPYVYRFGYDSMGNNGNFNDPDVSTYTYRSGNWDAFNEDVIWAVGSDETLPDSLYYSEKPSWFGNLNWPPFGPENVAVMSTNLIPAEARYLGIDYTTDTTPPTLSTAVIDAYGLTITLGWDKAVTIVGSAPTLTMTGGAVTATYSSGDGTASIVYDLSRRIYNDETGTLDIGADDFEDANSIGNEAISSFSVDNTGNEQDPPIIPGAGSIVTRTLITE